MKSKLAVSAMAAMMSGIDFIPLINAKPMNFGKLGKFTRKKIHMTRPLLKLRPNAIARTSSVSKG